MIESWRWFGPADPISLPEVRATGATGIVTALHEIPIGTAWPEEAIAGRKAMIEAAGLSWTVVESIPVSEAIKTRGRDRAAHIEAWKTTVRRLGAAGVSVVCYNLMPVVDWTRTDLAWPYAASGGLALRFDFTDFAAYDAFVLARPGAEADYDAPTLAAARSRLDAMDAEAVARLERTIIAGLPGTDVTYDRAGVRAAIAPYADISRADMLAIATEFLSEAVPAAEEAGVRLCVHPDDPPLPLFGTPRIVSTTADIDALLSAVDSPANGLTLCTGSLGARPDNDLVAMAERFGPRIHFAHLRNVRREDERSFHESDHLDGSVDMVGTIDALLGEERRRQAAGRADAAIPMRPDHGHMLGPDADRPGARPGYPYVGRLRGLAELRGVTAALTRPDRLPV